MSSTTMKTLLLAIAYSCVIPLLSAQTIEAPLRLLEARLEKETENTLPDFAPNLYKKAQESIADLRETFVKEGKLSDARLQQARLQLEQYRTVAQKSQRRLKKAYALRNSALHYNFIRSNNPNFFYKAEQKYAEAILLGEGRQFNLLSTHAKKVTADYQTLIKSAQLNLKNQVKPILKQYQAALKTDLQSVDQNTSDPSHLGQADEVFMRIKPSLVGIATDGTMLPPPFDPIPRCEGISPTTFSNFEAREAHSLFFAFGDNSTEETGNRLLRSTDAQNWQILAELGKVPRFERFTHKDTGLEASTQYCYMVETYNDKETCPTIPLCTHTRDTIPIPIWRLVLEVIVADVDDAGTDDEVFFQTGDFTNLNSTQTYLDYGRNDFERNSVNRYDLNLDGISELSDITELAIGIDGNDGVLIQEFSLFANNDHLLFHRYFGSSSSTALNLDSKRIYIVKFDELRLSPDWIKFVESAKADKLFNLPKIIINPKGEGLAIQIKNEEIVSRIEALVGHMLYTDPAWKGILDWGNISGPPVEVTRKDNNTLHVDLDLELQVDILPNPEMDIDFDLSITKICEEDDMTISIVSNNFTSNASTSIWEKITNASVGGILGLGTTFIGTTLINWYTENCTTPPQIKKELSMPLPENMDCNALEVRIDEGGNLVICCFSSSDF